MSYLELLCTSRIKGKLLRYFTTHTEQVSVGELSRMLQLDRSNIWKYIIELCRAGIVVHIPTHKHSYFYANTSHPAYFDIQAIATKKIT